MLSVHLHAQIIKSYTFSQLSANSYQRLSDSLKKNKNCPVVLANKKAQAEFEKSWKSRNERIAKDLDNNNYIKDNVVYPYIEAIVQELVSNNTQLIPYKVTVLLDRTEVANATSFGEHIIAVNAGIVISAQNKEELSLYIAHELAHDILKHTEQAMKAHAEIIVSDDYKESLKNVLSSKYGRYSQLMKITESMSFDRNRHSRYSEQAADSLAILLVKNSNISFDAASFLNLDTMGNQYQRKLSQGVRPRLNGLGITVDENWFMKRSRGLSAAKYNFKDISSKNDSLKTHPDCRSRYEHTLAQSSSTPVKTAIPKNVKDAAFEIAIMDLYVNRNITRCFYRLMQEKEAYENLPIYDFMSHALLNSLLVSVKDMERFNVLRIRKKEDVSPDYFELQNFLEQIPEKNLAESCAQLNKAPAPGKEEQGLIEYLQMMSTDNADKKTAVKSHTKNFKDSFPSSIYLELF
ncbi:MAG: M48 family metalloprotease [Chitinophagaceae bacterium]|nr:M48 family metalloprotease [Chitinophagaceae bacterium]